MSRIISEDFSDLCDYISHYKLDIILKDSDELSIISSCHKKYYAYLVIIEEFRRIIDNRKFNPVLNIRQFEFLQESCSDVGQAFFLILNGCYKGSKLLLRSSIENFLKGISLDEDSEIINQKSVYEVFDRAEVTLAFSGNKKNLIEDLHGIYAELCKDVHTADTQHMASINALRYFPGFDKKKGNSVSSTLKKIINIYITAMALKFNQAYHNIEYENKEILNQNILNDFKQLVHNIAI